MIQKYKAALKVVKEYVAKIAVAIKSTNTMIGKLMSARPQARFSLAQHVALKQRSFLAIDREWMLDPSSNSNNYPLLLIKNEW